MAADRPPDAMLLDLGLPDMDGIEVITAFRGWSRAPIIVLSGRTSPGDKIGALDAGADDYVTKPFAMDELLARLRAALRRDEGARPTRHRPAAIGCLEHRPRRAQDGHNPASGTVPADSVAATPDSHRVAAPGGPAAPPGPAGQLRPAARGRVGPRLPGPDELPAVSHGAAAPQARGRPVPAPAPAHRAGHGLPLPALTRRQPPHSRVLEFRMRAYAWRLMMRPGTPLEPRWLHGDGTSASSRADPRRAARTAAAEASGFAWPGRSIVAAVAVVRGVAGRVLRGRMTMPAALASGVIGWLFYDGFLIGRHADLVLGRPLAGWSLLVLVAAALCGSALGPRSRKR